MDNTARLSKAVADQLNYLDAEGDLTSVYEVKGVPVAAVIEDRQSGLFFRIDFKVTEVPNPQGE